MLQASINGGGIIQAPQYILAERADIVWKTTANFD
ncbi:hypothetical protein NIES4102_09890 [Chondrocystis sp. NIES-4102]|nr:hypothetical protein NIES4102_09890 [Chondrocystis sp. NIES-4102]